MCVLMVSYYQGRVCISCLRPGLPERLFVAVSQRARISEGKCKANAEPSLFELC